jgi:hypothetical protein
VRPETFADLSFASRIHPGNASRFHLGNASRVHPGNASRVHPGNALRVHPGNALRGNFCDLLIHSFRGEGCRTGTAPFPLERPPPGSRPSAPGSSIPL